MEFLSNPINQTSWDITPIWTHLNSMSLPTHRDRYDMTDSSWFLQLEGAPQRQDSNFQTELISGRKSHSGPDTKTYWQTDWLTVSDNMTSDSSSGLAPEKGCAGDAQRNWKLQTRLLVREGVPHQQIRSYPKIIKKRRRKLVADPRWVPHTKTDWRTNVGRNITLTLVVQ
jgi:hypothetical protein